MIEYLFLTLPSFVAGGLALALYQARRVVVSPPKGSRVANRAARIALLKDQRIATRAERRKES